MESSAENKEEVTDLDLFNLSLAARELRFKVHLVWEEDKKGYHSILER